MNYEQQIQRIEQNIGTMFEWEDVTDRANHKLYPFYYFQNFHDVGELTPNCDYCGQSLRKCGNGSYYMAYVIFENGNSVKLCCSTRHCYRYDILDYHNQIYGHRKPIELGKYHGSLIHELVFKCLMNGSYRYKAWTLTNGITEKDLSFHSWSGGTLDLSMFKGQWQMKDKVIEYYKFGENKNVITKSQCVKAMNEIIFYNLEQQGAVPGQQLKLF